MTNTQLKFCTEDNNIITSTRWERTNINYEHLALVMKERIRMLNDFDVLDSKPLPMGISKTCYPDGSEKSY